MKKSTYGIVVLVLMTSLFACTSTGKATNDKTSASPNTQSESTSGKSAATDTETTKSAGSGGAAPAQANKNGHYTVQNFPDEQSTVTDGGDGSDSSLASNAPVLTPSEQDFPKKTTDEADKNKETQTKPLEDGSTVTDEVIIPVETFTGKDKKGLALKLQSPKAIRSTPENTIEADNVNTDALATEAEEAELLAKAELLKARKQADNTLNPTSSKQKKPDAKTTNKKTVQKKTLHQKKNAQTHSTAKKKKLNQAQSKKKRQKPLKQTEKKARQKAINAKSTKEKDNKDSDVGNTEKNNVKTEKPQKNAETTETENTEKTEKPNDPLENEQAQEEVFSNMPKNDSQNNDTTTVSRSMKMLEGQQLDVWYPGEKWIYLGEKTSQSGLKYLQRRLKDRNSVYTFEAKKQGDYILTFSYFDAFSNKFLTDALAVHVAPEKGRHSERVRAPDYKEAKTISAILPDNEKSSAEVKTAKIPRKNSREIKQKVQPSAVQDKSDLLTNETLIETPIEGGASSDDETRDNDLLAKAEKAIAEGNAEKALQLLDDFFIAANSQLDKGWFLRGKAFELNTPERNIRKALAAYKTITSMYRHSKFWKPAQNRIRYIERFYINIE